MKAGKAPDGPSRVCGVATSVLSAASNGEYGTGSRVPRVFSAGIRKLFGPRVLTGCLLADNEAAGSPGAPVDLDVTSTAGGGVAFFGGELTVTDCTFTHNRSVGGAGSTGGGGQDVPVSVDCQMTGAWSVRSRAHRSDDTDARREARRCFGRSDRSAQDIAI
jgi:hypothetical protein